MRDPRYYEVHAALLVKLPQLRRRCASAEQLPAKAIVVRSAVESERTGMFWHRRAGTYHPALLHALRLKPPRFLCTGDALLDRPVEYAYDMIKYWAEGADVCAMDAPARQLCQRIRDAEFVDECLDELFARPLRCEIA